MAILVKLVQNFGVTTLDPQIWHFLGPCDIPNLSNLAISWARELGFTKFLLNSYESHFFQKIPDRRICDAKIQLIRQILPQDVKFTLKWLFVALIE